MNIVDLFVVQQLEARRRRLKALLARPNLRARIGGTELGEAAEDVTEDVVEQLLPIVELNLAQRIDGIEAEMRKLGVVIA